MNLHRTILKCTLNQTWEYAIISPKIFSQELTVYRQQNYMYQILRQSKTYRV